MTPERKTELFRIVAEELELRAEDFACHDWNWYIENGLIEAEELDYFRRHVVIHVELSDTNE